MNRFAVRCYDGRQARALAGTLTVDPATRTARLDCVGREPQEFPWAALRIEPPLGRTARRVGLPDGESLELDDSAEFRAVERLFGRRTRMAWVAALEAHRGAILAAIAIVAAFVFVGVRFGLPAMAHSVAFKLPPEAMKAVSDQTLATLDRVVFSPSELPTARQDEVRRALDAAARRVPGVPPHEVLFRDAAIGPNAFALPSGQIIFTDEMVRFAKSDDELVAVFGHELGHVAERHGMRLVLQQLGVLLAISFFFGDISGPLTSAGALPIVLVESGYSREFEQAADDYGIRFALKAGIGTRPMTDLFTRLRQRYPDGSVAWLSSHPQLAERIRRAQEQAPR